MTVEYDRISQTFDGKNIFITGATGFMGKVLIDRLLRTTNVTKLYLLVRNKRNKASAERFREILNDPLFDKLKGQMSVEEILNKIHLINGDCSKVDLDLSDDDRQLITKNISMIFNFAATVSFNEKFKHAMEMNVRSVRDLIKLARDCENLEIFCHLSTAYCHLNETVLYEKTYNCLFNPNAIIEMVENSSDDEVNKILSKFIDENIPSSYAMSKQLAEKLIVDMNEEFKLPVMIIRPGVVLSLLEDPLPGWTDNYQALNGFTIAFCTGILRSVYVEKGCVNNFNIIPVDVAIGNIMLCTWNYINENQSSVTSVYNLENFPWQPFKYIEQNFPRIKDEFLIGYLIWCPKLNVTSSRVVHQLRSFFYHWIPAYTLDFLLKIFGHKPFLVQTHERIIKGLRVQATTKKIFTFKHEKIKAISNNLNQQELVRYTAVNFNEDVFLPNFVKGLRKYLMKMDDEKTMSRCKELFEWFKMADNIIKFVILFAVARIIFKIFNAYW